MFIDHKGYYSILGVQFNATSALIRAAYRVRAMELHPDRNSSASATRETQLLNQAYEILGEETRRREYDASCRKPNPSVNASVGDSAQQDTKGNTKQRASEDTGNEAVLCSFCQALTVQPRYRELTTVFSYGIGSHRSMRRGILCIACERKYSTWSTGITSLAGWWGIYGFFWSFEAIYKNLTGSWRFAPQDAMLSCAQALYLARKGNSELAHAVAMDAFNIAQHAPPGTREQRRRAGLGYEPEDRLKEVRAVMSDLIQRTKAAGCTRELHRPSRARQASFLIQAAFVAVLIAGATMIAVNIYADNQRIEMARIRAEQARLQREGFERDRARAIAERQAEELRAMEQPTPSSGVFSVSLPRSRFHSSVGLPSLKVHAPSGQSYFLKLSDWISGAAILTVFIRSGDTVDISVPLGAYRLSMAAGTTWYGESIRFGPDTTYSQIDQSIVFSVQGDQLVGHEIELSRVLNGNLRPSVITADQF